MKISSFVHVCGLFCFGASSFLGAFAGDLDWNQWRGPNRDGAFTGPEWPEKLSPETVKLKWRVSLDKGYSSPIIGDKYVFTVETEKKKNEIVRALDINTGEEVWRHSWEGSMKVPFFAASNGSWVRSTPAYDGENVYVGGMRDVIVCLDAQTGKQKWVADLKKRYGTPLPSFGFVCSPMLVGNYVFVQGGGGLVKLDRETGESAWRSMADGGGMYDSAFSSPVIATIHGKEQLVVLSRKKLAGIDYDTGEVLWEQPVKAFRDMNILTPTVKDNSVFTASYGGTAQRFSISSDYEVSLDWDTRVQGYMSSPMLVNDHLFMHMRNQRMVCLNWKTGDKTWTSDRTYGKYISMIHQGDRILGLTETGKLLLIKANSEKWDLLSGVDLSKQQTWAHLGMVGNRIYIRELESIAVFEWKEANDAEANPADTDEKAPKEEEF